MIFSETHPGNTGQWSLSGKIPNGSLLPLNRRKKVKENKTPEQLGMVPIKGGYQFPHLLPAADVQRDEIVRELVAEAADLNKLLKDYKAKCEEMLVAHVALVNETEEPAPRDLNGSYETLDGTLVVEVDYAPVVKGTEKMVQLKSLLRAALEELGEELDPATVAMIKGFLRVDGSSPDLRSLERNKHQAVLMRSASWREAVDLLPDCTVVNGYHPYFRFFRVDEEGVRTPVFRNFSAISTGRKMEDGK